MNRIIYCFLLFLPLFLLHSCKTPQASRSQDVEVTDNAYAGNNKTFDCCKIKMRATVQLGSHSLPATGVLQVIDGKWMSCSFRVPLLGIEVVRVEADNDTLLVVNRYDKSYVKVPMQTVEDYSGLSYGALQALIMNDFFSLAGKSHIDAGQSDRGSSPDATAVYAESNRKTTLTFMFDAMTRIIASSVEVGSNYSMRFDYSDFQLKQGRYYPSSINVSVSDGRHEAGLQLTSTGIDFSAFEPSPASLGNRYREMHLSDFLSSLHL